jgi:hypothetical protein
MLWAAVAGARFRMPAAYAAVPNADGTTAFGTPPSALSLWMEAIQARGVTIVARGTVREQIGQDLRAARVSDVVVGMTPRAQMVAFFADLFGRPPDELDGVELWRHVDSAGRSRIANSGSTALVDPDADDGSDAPVAACMPQTRLGTQGP